MDERRSRPRSTARRSRGAGFAGLGVLASLLLVTGVVKATGLPWPTASPSRSQIPATAIPTDLAAAPIASAAAALVAAAPTASADPAGATGSTPDAATAAALVAAAPAAPVSGTSLVWSPSGALKSPW